MKQKKNKKPTEQYKKLNSLFRSVPVYTKALLRIT